MKAMILAISLIASSAFAGVQYQMVGGVPANNLCDAGDVFKTLSPVTVCDQWQEVPGKWDGDHFEPGNWVCLSSHSENQSVSKEIDVCLEWSTTEQYTGCVKNGKGVQGNATVAQKVSEHGDVTSVEYFTYTIPACK